MRVVARKKKTKKFILIILQPPRPTLDRVKEAMFSSIQFDLIDATVVDLFSGTGALGLEAISRGAKKVVFVDNNREAIKVVKENLSGVNEDYDIEFCDYEKFLEKHKNDKFDIFLLDPPFKTDFAKLAIDKILANNMLNDDGIIVYEKAKDKKVEFNDKNMNIKTKTYGTVEVVFLRKAYSKIRLSK